jgi:hypothetical protein
MSVKHDALKKAGHIVPWVSWRMVANGRRGPKKPQPIVRLVKAWKRACLDAGCPRRIPHDPRRTAVRNLTRVGVATAVAKKITTTLSARETYATRLNCWTRRHLIDAVHSCQSLDNGLALTYRSPTISFARRVSMSRSEWLFSVVLTGFLCATSSSAQSLAGQPTNAIEPTTAILDAFQSHPVVALGEGTHGNEQGHTFRLALIRDPRFASTVNDIVVEFGSARYQDLMDRFVRGEDVPTALLRQVWQNTTQASAVWDQARNIAAVAGVVVFVLVLLASLTR